MLAGIQAQLGKGDEAAAAARLAAETIWARGRPTHALGDAFLLALFD